MNYLKHYEQLVDRAKRRAPNCYTELHHIVPRCLGGKDTEDNLVRLTPEEHYVAHQLLVKMYPENRKLLKALMMMSVSSYKNGVRNNKMYGWIRRRFSESNSGCGNHRSKLTATQVLEIYYSCEKTSTLSDQYQIGTAQITSVKRKRSYKNILSDIKDPPGYHPSLRRIPLSDETVIRIFRDSGPPIHFKERYGVSVSVVRRIKNRITYDRVTKNLKNPGQLVLHKLSPEDVFEIRNSKKSQDKELLEKFKIHPETLRNIRTARTRKFVEIFD